ncbi:MAG: ABC transporter permease [Roseburia sp.]|nr:ABC transporter permease [Roseburia sp.]
MADIVYCEWLKLKRSKILLIGVLGSLMVPFLVAVNDIRIAAAKPEASLSLYGLYEDTMMFIMLLFGPLVLAVVATYLINREYTERTLKTIFVLPVERAAFLSGKFIMLFLLISLFMLLSWLDILVIALVCHLFLGGQAVTAFQAAVILLWMERGGMLMFMTLTPFVYLALRTKGSIAPFIVIAGISLLNVVLSASPIACFWPWTASWLLQTGRYAQTGGSARFGFLLLAGVCGLGICAALRRFGREEV